MNRDFFKDTVVEDAVERGLGEYQTGGGVRVTDPTIIYTHTDEAPALATYSFLPVVRAYASTAGRQRRDPRHLAGRAHHRQLPGAPRAETSASATPSPSSASWPRRPKPTSSSCRTSRPRSRSSRRPSPSCSSRATRCPTTRTTRRPTTSATSAPATTRSRAAPSTRCCARATPTAARPPRSRTTPGRTRTRMGAWTPDSKTNVAHMDGRRLPLHRAVGRDRRGRHAAHRAGRRRRQHDGAARVGAGAGRRGRRRVRHARRGAARVPRRRRSRGPRPRACCSRCTSRPR